MTLTHITEVLKDLRITIEKLKLETLSIAKTDTVNNVPWSNIKSLLQLTFIDSPTKIIICNDLIKYLPRNLRPTIIGETHCLPTENIVLLSKLITELNIIITGKI